MMTRIIDALTHGSPQVRNSFAANIAAHGLPYSQLVRNEVDHLYPSVQEFIPEVEWPAIAPLVAEINRLKQEKNAVILAHNYMTPDIYFLVGDFRGDSLQLAQQAASVDADVIVQAGVHFMAETSKILAPEKTVLIPDTEAGCSLAASITAKDVQLIRQKYPSYPIITYVNCTAEVKAECDITCTSSNAVQVVQAITAEWGVDTAIMVPDQYLAKNVAAMTDIRILTWPGACEVHELFSADDVTQLRDAYPGVVVLAHPECPPDVLTASDFAGSTSALSHYVQEKQPPRVVLLTECSMSDNVASENPEIKFVRPCNLCPHMKRITLANIFDCLTEMKHEVIVDEYVRVRAKEALEAMMKIPIQPMPMGYYSAERKPHVEMVH